MKALIVTGGKINNEFLIKTINETNFDTIIAVDNGLKILNEVNITPNHIVGDFDTVPINKQDDSFE